MLPKVLIISKNVSVKSCSKFNLVEKKIDTYLYLPRSGARGRPTFDMDWDGKVGSL